MVVGDIGEKVGLNGIDNGFVMFKNYRIKKDNLLNRTGDVNDDGVYESVRRHRNEILKSTFRTFSFRFLASQERFWELL